jgi:two-component system sensor histidine kinase ChvG
MALVTASTRNDPPFEWRQGLGFASLRARIFAVNLVAVFVLAIMLLYLDTVRARLLDERMDALGNEALAIAGLASDLPPALERLSFARGTRIRLYAADGGVITDNWRQPVTTRFAIENPADYSWRRASAKFIDRALERLLRTQPLPAYAEATPDRASHWPEIAAARRLGQPQTRLRRAADGSFVIGAAAALPGGRAVHLTDNADDLAGILRAERLTSLWLWLFVTGLTASLSWFLARTIVRPLRLLAVAAHRVRLGRSREVVVPRLPERRDEIGALARALSDMSIALRRQIDATEAFAADVAHELKNPLASLRSAVDALDRVEQPALREQLLAVIRDDVTRIDRLITDIADASRLDAELSRTGFQRVDMTRLCEGLVAAYGIAGTGGGRGVHVVLAPPPDAPLPAIDGDASRLAQVLRNLIDNAISFSPDGGTVTLRLGAADGHVFADVCDEGPGVPAANRRDIFRRFYSERPAAEDFGRHSGLGLSIAAAIVAAHGGNIGVDDGPGGGAVFRVALPAG